MGLKGLYYPAIEVNNRSVKRNGSNCLTDSASDNLVIRL